MRSTRRIYSSLAILALLVAAPAWGQSAKAIEAGKKDGKVVIYGSLESDTTDAIKTAFTKKTGIEVGILARLGD